MLWRFFPVPNFGHGILNVCYQSSNKKIPRSSVSDHNFIYDRKSFQTLVFSQAEQRRWVYFYGPIVHIRDSLLLTDTGVQHEARRLLTQQFSHQQQQQQQQQQQLCQLWSWVPSAQFTTRADSGLVLMDSLDPGTYQSCFHCRGWQGEKLPDSTNGSVVFVHRPNLGCVKGTNIKIKSTIFIFYPRKNLNTKRNWILSIIKDTITTEVYKKQDGDCKIF